MEKINVKGKDIEILSKGNNEYISLTSIAKYKNPKEPKDIIKNWIRNRSTIEFLGL
ncbi:MAG: KilA-N domain-containing protein, partial [Candidatus Dojkabacteria bacterium]|nr:KilA-N domain-containing protein [Candidatus Dojkabacteria bacterium]